MSRLLSANFARLFKSKLFWGCMIYALWITISYVIMTAMDSAVSPENYPNGSIIDDSIYTGSLELVIAAAAFVGIFLGTEYSDGTIRNKLSVGHSRVSVFLSDFITCAAANCMMMLTNIISMLILGSIVLDGTTLTSGEIFLRTVLVCFATASVTAIFVFIIMVTQSKAGGSVVSLISVFAMIIFAAILMQGLVQPQFYDEYQPVINQETGETLFEMVTVENPFYITGAQRQVFMVINDILPINQLFQISGGFSAADMRLLAVYSCGAAALICLGGSAMFAKKDLK